MVSRVSLKGLYGRVSLQGLSWGDQIRRMRTVDSPGGTTILGGPSTAWQGLTCASVNLSSVLGNRGKCHNVIIYLTCTKKSQFGNICLINLTLYKYLVYLFQGIITIHTPKAENSNLCNLTLVALFPISTSKVCWKFQHLNWSTKAESS